MSKREEKVESESKAKVAPPVPPAGPTEDVTPLDSSAIVCGARPGTPPQGLEPSAAYSSCDSGQRGEGEDLAPLPSPTIPRGVRAEPPPATTLLTPLPEERIHLAIEAGRKRAKKHKLAPRVPVPTETYRFSNALTPDMFALYLSLARGRCASLGTAELAERVRVDEELVERIVVSPLYMAFEATFRTAMNSGTELEAVQRRLAEVAPATVERLIWWSEQTSPQTAAVALAAIKMILSANGVTTEKKAVERSRTTMSPDQQARLLAVFEVKRR